MCHPLVFVQMIVFLDYGQVRGAGAGCGGGVCHLLVLVHMIVFRDCGQVRGAGAGCGGWVCHPLVFVQMMVPWDPWLPWTHFSVSRTASLWQLSVSYMVCEVANGQSCK